MGRIAERMYEYGLLGGLLGVAVDGLIVATTGPVGLGIIAAKEVSKAAAFTLGGAAIGAVEGAVEEINGEDEE